MREMWAVMSRLLTVPGGKKMSERNSQYRNVTWQSKQTSLRVK